MAARIFIVDDNIPQRVEVRDALTRQGYLVVGEAGIGLHAVRQARELCPDLVIVDAALLNEDSFATIGLLTQEMIAPVLLLTASSDRSFVRYARKVGVMNYRIKPLRESEVAPTIEMTLARYHQLYTLCERASELLVQLAIRQRAERVKGLMIEYGLTAQEAEYKVQPPLNKQEAFRTIYMEELFVRGESDAQSYRMERDQRLRGETMPTRVIIADDETIQRMDLRDVLTKQGYLVIGEAGDGQSAVNLARELRPDLVIMDIRMPDVDGITAAETLTQEKIAPVLLLTAFGDQPLVERAKEAGVVNYVVKPLRESEVAPAIEVALARYNEFRALEEKAHTLSEQLETRKIVERAKGLLMEKQGLSEQEAFRKIQKASMNNRKSMREVAEAILLTNEM